MSWRNNINEDSLLRLELPIPFEEACERLKSACFAKEFNVVGSFDLQKEMSDCGEPIVRRVSVFEVLEPVRSRKMLEAEMGFSCVLPMQISVSSSSDGKIAAVTALRPAALFDLFKVGKLVFDATKAEKAMVALFESLKTEGAGSES